MIRPNLYIVGFQKCGSSTLFDYLSAHQDITGTIPKETYFLVDDSYELYDSKKNVSKSPEEWNTFLPEKINTKIIMEASVCNFSQNRALAYIQGIPDAKIIFILRDPIKRFISTYNYNISWILKEIGNISLTEYYHLVQQKSVGRFMCDHAIEHGFYSKYIHKWKNALGEEKVFITGLN